MEESTPRQLDGDAESESEKGGSSSSTRSHFSRRRSYPYDEARTEDDVVHRLQSRLGRNRLVRFLSGPNPPRPISPYFNIPFSSRFAFLRRLQQARNPLAYRLPNRRYLAWIYLAAWLVGFVFLARKSWYDASMRFADGSEWPELLGSERTFSPAYVGSTASYWDKDAACGMNGTLCSPPTNVSDTFFWFRCAAGSLSSELLNNRAVGAEEIIYQPLVVGGQGGRYRADSWICAAAVHAGLFGDGKGGCGALYRSLAGAEAQSVRGYVAEDRNGVVATPFPTIFEPGWIEFFSESEITGANCEDRRWEILALNVAMSVGFSLLFDPPPLLFFWVMFITAFWHIVLASDPSAIPPDISTAIGRMFPAAFVAYVAFWRCSFRWVLPGFSGRNAPERTLWYLGGLWFGTSMNVTLGWIPLDRLTPHDIKQRPGGLIALLVIVLIVLLLALNQLRSIWREGVFWRYLGWYATGVAVWALTWALPGLEFRLHHYFFSTVLAPALAFPTRPSAFLQAFLLGIFLNGVARWGFDPILQTAAELVGDGATGSGLPDWVTSNTTWVVGQREVLWNATLPEEGGWDGWAVIVDDVLRYTGTFANYTLDLTLDATLPHFVRLGFWSSTTSSYGDFTKAATAWIGNGTWVNAEPGVG